jgi:hypothetical protein
MQTTLINNRSSKLFITIMLLGLLSGCVKPPFPLPPTANEEPANVVYGWYKLVAKIQLNTTPPQVTLQNIRNLSYVGVGLYEAVRPGIRGAVSLSTKLYQMPAMPAAENWAYSWSESANAALASMFRQLLGGLTDANKASMDSLEKVYNDRFRSHISNAVFTRSQTFGRSIATAIYNWSTTDNFTTSSVGYVLPVFPGSWVPTPPAFAPPLGAFLINSRPFLKSSLTSALPPPPLSYSKEPSSSFYKAAKELYDIGKALTAEQKAIAYWWADFGGPGIGFQAGIHPLNIVTDVLQSKNVKLGQAAEIYAKASIAMKDGIFRTWRSKFHYNLLRPVTYINNIIDPAWTSYLPTPPYPEYTSGLVSLYAPSMQVLKRAFGDIPVTDYTYTFRGDAPRKFNSFSKLVDEVALSRIYGGIHYRFTQNISVEFGTHFGDEVANIKLVPSEHGNDDY